MLKNIGQTNIEKIVVYKWIGEYFVKHGVPLLGIDDNGQYCFAKSKVFKEVYDNAPLHIKFFVSFN